MSSRTSLGKYIDSTALMFLDDDKTPVRPGYSNISCAEDPLRISLHLAVQWCPLSWKFQLRKKDKVFIEPFCKRERKILSQYKGSNPYVSST